MAVIFAFNLSLNLMANFTGTSLCGYFYSLLQMSLKGLPSKMLVVTFQAACIALHRAAPALDNATQAGV